jgi:hypothetical protein
MAFRRHLAEQGLSARRSSDPVDLDEDELDVESPLLRATSAGMMGHDAGQAFIVGYLLTWAEAQGLDLPRETRVFQESLDFARRRIEREREEVGKADDVGPKATPTPEHPKENDEDVGDNDATGGDSDA